MEWDHFATDVIGGFGAFGSACGTYKGIEYLINKLPQSMIHPEGSRSLIESLGAEATKVIPALGVWLGVVYLTQIAVDKEWLYRARSKCGDYWERLQSYRERRAAEREIEEQRRRRMAEEETPFTRGKGNY